MKSGRIFCLITFLLALSILFAMPAAASSAQSGTYGDNITWTFDSDGTLTLSGTGDMKDPGSEALPWAALGMQRLIIEDGITGICDRAFQESGYYVTDLTLPESLTSIGGDGL